MFDNFIILDCTRKKSGEIALGEKEKSVLITTTRRDVPVPVPIRLIRRSRKGYVSAADLKIGHGYQKFKIDPFHSLELEIANWNGLEGRFPFNVITGTNMELLFFDLCQQVHSLNFSTRNGQFFIMIGHSDFSFITVERGLEGYKIQFSIRSRELLFNEHYSVKGNALLERIFIKLREDMKNAQAFNPENNTSPRIIQQKNEVFHGLIHKHFKPVG